MNWMKETGHPKVHHNDQGFVDSNGYFYKRSTAKCIAILNGQVKHIFNELTSEDLWTADGNPLTPT
jgi:hypothetical protein